jgi:8-oxo-dGTP pyrophosphatase MutT (NUDIX family)
MIRPWPLANSKVEISNRIFTLKTDTCRSPRTGKEHDFYILEAGSWVNVIPLTSTGQVVLVRQFRHGTRQTTIEIPGGLVEDGQTPAEAAARELLEETGYASGNLILLGRTRPNPAILNNWCYSYLAEGVSQVAERELDEAEDLEVVLADLADIPGMIKHGDIDHALVLSAFYYYHLHMNKVREV